MEINIPPASALDRTALLIGSGVADICRGRDDDESENQDSGTTVIQTDREQKNDMWSSMDTHTHEKEKFKK